MRQKYQIVRLLEQHFNQVQQDLSFIKIKKINSKKCLFKTGDLINQLFFIINGSVSLSFQQKQLLMPPQIIIGDFEPAHNLSRRTTTLKTISKVQIVILPIDYYFNIKQEILEKQRFLTSNILSKDKRIEYLVSKYFHKISVNRGQQIKLQHLQNSNDLALIRYGIFSIKKYIGVSVIKEHKIEISRNFSLCQLGEEEFVRQNITCQTNKGEVFLCPNMYLNQLKQNFEEFSTQLLYKSRKDTVAARQHSIKSICFPGSQLANSILPSVFKKQKQKQHHISRTKINKKNRRIRSQQHSNLGQENHYLIKRTQMNQLYLIPTFSNLSLIPLCKKGKIAGRIKTTRPQIYEQHHSLNQQSKLTKQSQVSQDKLIPKIFDSKFKRKMFYKAQNPFSHFKSKSLSLQEHILNQKIQLKSNPILFQNNILVQLSKKKSLHIQTNQFQI